MIAADVAGNRGESVQRAYDLLRELIVHGRLAPGSRIIESEIADRLGLSRTPIRSALHRLQQEGYVTSVDRTKEKRLIVAPLTQADAMELFQIVGQLEGLAARAAAERPASVRAELVTRLRALNADFAAAGCAVPPDPSRLFDLDTAFHRAYVEAGAGARLLALHEATKPQAERYARLYVNALLVEIATSAAEHELINQAIEAGAESAAQQAVESNWRNAGRRLAVVIGARGALGSW
ncbi:MAG: GntR family transcriptional regulator [Gemmatimonadota bacterium]|nr:GntR family transcriptional regulator [Gemmatimonadota bacterium]MDQ8167270.1 GntR family transcriptional regulator [Gemmatimonadota bacterium]MDQ8172036.1 GntR family transcriptional regulator [Gemmatimonadota bacterium]